jgi:predicted nuclease with TOPRIM domain
LHQDAVDAINRKDIKRFLQLFGENENDEGELGAAEQRLSEAADKINSMSNDYFSQMHDEFVSLRNKADKIKSEFLILSPQLKVQPLDFSIEGW